MGTGERKKKRRRDRKANASKMRRACARRGRREASRREHACVSERELRNLRLNWGPRAACCRAGAPTLPTAGSVTRRTRARTHAHTQTRVHTQRARSNSRLQRHELGVASPGSCSSSPEQRFNLRLARASTETSRGSSAPTSIFFSF